MKNSTKKKLEQAPQAFVFDLDRYIAEAKAEKRTQQIRSMYWIFWFVTMGLFLFLLGRGSYKREIRSQRHPAQG